MRMTGKASTGARIFMRAKKTIWLSVAIAGFFAVPALAQSPQTAPVQTAPAQTTPVEISDVVKSYANLALASYEDALRTARDLRGAIETLLATPNKDNLEAARTAWKTARIPYQQSEVFRFGNPVVEAWQSRVNAAPLDEGFIDYVDPSYSGKNSDNPLYEANIIANKELMIDGKSVSIAKITPSLIAGTLEGAAGVKTNVASGYHAIEFLLWGQDLNGVKEGAGTRKASDYDLENCTNDNCARRAEYLFAVANLLVSDLEEMVSDWKVTGAARRGVIADPEAGLRAILKGMGDLSYYLLAGERMKRPLLTNNPELELDDFSDYTYASLLFDARGVVNVYFGEYFAIDGSTFKGASIADLVKQADDALDVKFRDQLGVTVARIGMIVDQARGGEVFDQMIAPGNTKGKGLIEAAITVLVAQSQTIKKIAVTLGLKPLELTGSDVL